MAYYISNVEINLQMKKSILVLFSILVCSLALSQNLYFPPINNNLPWDTISPQNLGWCSNKIDSLYEYLQQENSKAFIVLKDGKIVLEKYFGQFTKDSVWYWASAGKSLTSVLIGKAKEDGILKLTDSTSKYLGPGWTAETRAEEGKISVWNQITMTSGLDDNVPDNHCTLDTCLRFLDNPGSRWAYHNAPYTLLEKVIESAAGMNINQYTQQKIKNQTGMTGAWFQTGYDNLFVSKARSMARFGILVQNKGKWANTTVLADTAYIRQMINSSQQLNKAYGYLWWLNGKGSYMVPTLQTVFPGSYAPDASSDMYAAIGKNGQILSISPSTGIIFVRMGNSTNAGEVPFQFCNQIWKRLNAVICQTTGTSRFQQDKLEIQLFPNPAKDQLNVVFAKAKASVEINIKDVLGRKIRHEIICGTSGLIDIKGMKPGFYILEYSSEKGSGSIKFQKE